MLNRMRAWFENFQVQKKVCPKNGPNVRKLLRNVESFRLRLRSAPFTKNEEGEQPGAVWPCRNICQAACAGVEDDSRFENIIVRFSVEIREAVNVIVYLRNIECPVGWKKRRNRMRKGESSARHQTGATMRGGPIFFFHSSSFSFLSARMQVSRMIRTPAVLYSWMTLKTNNPAEWIRPQKTTKKKKNEYNNETSHPRYRIRVLRIISFPVIVKSPIFSVHLRISARNDDPLFSSSDFGLHLHHSEVSPVLSLYSAFQMQMQKKKKQISHS